MDLHNKATGFERRLGGYILENYRLGGMDLEGYGLASQRMQADALGGAFAGWRRLWRGRGREQCGGALVWQVSYPPHVASLVIDPSILCWWVVVRWVYVIGS